MIRYSPGDDGCFLAYRLDDDPSIEACRMGSVSAEIASLVMEKAFDCFDAPIGRVGTLEAPIPFTETMESVLPSLETIKEECLEVLGYEI